MAAAALVLARVPWGLEPLLGAEGCAALGELLRGQALAWGAGAVGQERVAVAADADLEPAARAAFARFGGPLLIVIATMPRLGAAHAAGALTDMEAGADASFGPALDGGYYLLALREPHDGLLALSPHELGGPGAMGRSLQLAGKLELDVGLLRTERTLETPEDAAAVLADPLTPPRLRAVLER